jgi:hypothetical protein
MLNSRRLTVNAIAAAVALSTLAAARAAQAFTIVDDPFGDAPSQAYVNKDPDDNTMWINWKNLNTGACAFTFLGGAAGFNDDYEINLLGGNDSLVVVTTTGQFSFCGYPMTAPLYNGHALDVRAGAGNDSIYAGSGASFILFGDDGDDRILTSRFDVFMWGGTGNDSMRNAASGTPNAFGSTTQGGPGNDCIRINTSLDPAQQECGSGFDSWFGPDLLPFDCEVQSNAACPGEIE